MKSKLKLANGLELPLDVVSRRTSILGQTDTGKTSTAVVMVEEAAKCGAQFVVIDPTDAWWGLNSSANGKGPGVDCVVMGGPHGDVPLDEHGGKIVAGLVADENYNLVLCLDKLGSWSARQRFVADFMSELYEKAHSQILVVIDEAHRFAPQGALDPNGHAARCLGAVSDVVLLGRRKGLATVCISQRPARLHKDVLEMSEIVMAHRLRGNNDRKAFQGWIDEVDLDAKAIMSAVGGLKKGVAHVSAPTLGINASYAIRKKETFDSSKSIGVGEVAVEPKVRAKIDLDDLRSRMAATIEKAKADDPKELRKKIVKLEKDLGEAQQCYEDYEATIEAHAELESQVKELVARSTITPEMLEKIETTVAGFLVEQANELAATAEALRGFTETTLGGTLLTIVSNNGGERREARPRPSPSHKRPSRSVPVARPTQARQKPTDLPTAAAGRSLVKAERKIVAVLAQFPQGRSVRQIALLTGYSAKGGGFRNALSSLRGDEIISRGEPIRLLVDAESLGVPVESLPEGHDLLNHWLSQLGKAEREILKVLADEWLDNDGYVLLPIDVIAHRTNYAVSGGGFRNALSKLRTLELIEGRGELSLTEDFGEAIS